MIASEITIIAEIFPRFTGRDVPISEIAKAKLAAGKTAKSILISCSTRLAPFAIDEVLEITSYDELHLDKLGDELSALFIIISDTDATFNFLVAIMYSQLFNLLCTKADNSPGGKLDYHVRCLLDEFANIGEIPQFEKLIATIRSREISASIILQAKSQLKAIYKDNADTIEGNCDTMLFLGGKEKSTLKEISESLGKETIDSFNTSTNRGQSESYGMNYQKLGKELKSQDELAVMDGGKCILQVRGVRPFFSDKFDITRHKQYKPNDKAAFGYHLSEPAFYDLAQRYHDGEDIRRELALGLLEGSGAADIEFIFEQGEISDRTYYYAENLRHSLHTERTEDGFMCSFGGMERFVSFEEIGQAFIDRTHEEFNDLAFWWVRDDMLDAIPDISDEKIADLLTSFDGAALHGWENGDNIPKLNRIKKALYDILGDEVQTEKAFAIIAKEKYHVSFEAETPEKQPDSLTFHFGKDKGDEWVSESDIVHDFALAHPDCSFALGNAVLEYLDEKQHSERNIPELKAGWYKKTDFSITAVIDGEEFNYDGRFDIGDGKGTGGGSLIDHIRTYNEGILGYTQHPFNQPEYKERAQRMLDIFVPFLEAHSELTAEEQRIFDDFKAQHPIRTYDDVEKAQGTFKIYQLPGGEKYHGIRFESIDRLKADGVQLNKDDYELMYEGEVGEFRGNATLAFTTLTDDELPIQVTADLIDFKVTYEFDGEVYNTEQYSVLMSMRSKR